MQPAQLGTSMEAALGCAQAGERALSVKPRVKQAEVVERALRSVWMGTVNT